MVYRGKPAAGCQMCVQRRIYCDRNASGCSQCRRIGASCSGYRTEQELIMPAHLQQTTETMRKHGGRVLPLNACRLKPPGDGLQVLVPLAPPPAQDLDAIALAYCCHRHIIQPAPSTVKDEMLLSCMKALGLASYSNIARSDQLYAQALDFYNTALASVNAALGSRVDATNDSTLLSVFFLSCYEFAARTSLLQFFEGWTVHVKGLCTLIELRGAKQLESIEGRYLFLLACSFILRDHTRSAIPIPAHVSQLLDQAVNYDSRWRPLSLLMKVAELRTAITLGTMTDPGDIIAEARALDLQLASVHAAAPDWVMQSFDWPLQVGALLPGYIYLYRNSAAAMMLNSVRGGRIACHGLIVDILKRHPLLATTGDLRLEMDLSRTVIYRMQLDMVASIPHSLIMAGADPSEVITSLSSEVNSSHDMWPAVAVIPNQDLRNGSLPILALTRGYNLTFQLASAGGLEGTERAIRNAFCKALRFIGNRMGFAVASIFADALEDDLEVQLVTKYDHESVPWV